MVRGRIKMFVGKVFALISTLFVHVTLYVVARTLRRWRQDDTKGRGGTRKKEKKTTSTGLTAAEKKALGRKSRKALVGIISALVAALGVGGGVMGFRRWRLGNGASKKQHNLNEENGEQAIAVTLSESSL